MGDRGSETRGPRTLGDQLPAHDEVVLEGRDRDVGLKGDDGLALDGVGHPGVVGLDGHPIIDFEGVAVRGGTLEEGPIPDGQLPKS